MIISVDENSKKVKIYVPRNPKLSSPQEFYSVLKKYREENYLVSVHLEDDLLSY